MQKHILLYLYWLPWTPWANNVTSLRPLKYLSLIRKSPKSWRKWKKETELKGSVVIPGSKHSLKLKKENSQKVLSSNLCVKSMQTKLLTFDYRSFSCLEEIETFTDKWSRVKTTLIERNGLIPNWHVLILWNSTPPSSRLEQKSEMRE